VLRQIVVWSIVKDCRLVALPGAAMTLRERGVEAAERCVPSLLSQPEFNRPLYQTWRIQSTRTSRPHLQKHYTASNRVHMYDMLSSLGMHARWTCVCSPPVCFRSAPLSIAPRRVSSPKGDFDKQCPSTLQYIYWVWITATLARIYLPAHHIVTLVGLVRRPS
jgi:hypothetical protein